MASLLGAQLLEEEASIGNLVGSEDTMGRGWQCRCKRAHTHTHTALVDLEGMGLDQEDTRLRHAAPRE